MKNQLFIIACMVLAGNFSTHAQTWQWVRQGKAGNKAEGRELAVDQQNNVYVTGRFSESVDLNGTVLTSRGGNDIFVAKYNSAGTLQWAVSAGSPDQNIDDEVEGIAVDNSGNIYFTGTSAAGAVFGTVTLPKTAYFWRSSTRRVILPGQSRLPALMAITPGA